MLSNVKSMTRTFYPVGQGAFYREKFILKDENSESIFNIVYDCGTTTTQGGNNITDIINDWEKERIDILFISHFHDDHISRIPDLIKEGRPKFVVMPYLTTLEKQYYEIGLLRSCLDKKINDEDFYRLLENIKFISNSKEYLKKHESNTVFIAKEKDISNINDNLVVIPEGDLFTHEDKIEVLNKFEKSWVFDTFVSPRFNSSKIVDRFNKEIYEIEELIKDSNKLRRILLCEDKRQRIKEIYGRNINEMSLTLYSGPTNNDNFCQYIIDNYNYICPCVRNAGCLYTGDYNASKKKLYDDLKDHFGIYYDNIGCLQLPHHGANGSFNDDFLNYNWFYVACAGETNRYGHPGNKVVNKIFAKKESFFIITENTNRLEIKIRKINNLTNYTRRSTNYLKCPL